MYIRSRNCVFVIFCKIVVARSWTRLNLGVRFRFNRARNEIDWYFQNVVTFTFKRECMYVQI